jgi:predicted ester cyclase
MNPIEVVQNNVKNWQKHHADAIAAAYAEGGTYLHPISKEPFSGQAIAEFAKAVFAFYPDFSLDIVSIAQSGDSLVILEWLYGGTNTGAWSDPNAPVEATGKRVSCPGISLIKVQGDKILHERVYLDRLDEQKQLGRVSEEIV